MNTSLAFQMFVGDIIVWWRALVLWPGQKLVRCLCGICLLVATLGMPIPYHQPLLIPAHICLQYTRTHFYVDRIIVCRFVVRGAAKQR